MAKKKTAKKTAKKAVAKKKVAVKKPAKKIIKKGIAKKTTAKSNSSSKTTSRPKKGSYKEVEPAPSAAAVCKYQVTQVIPRDCGELQVGDMICFPCPDNNGKCPAIIGELQIKGTNCKFTVHQFGEECVRNATDCIKIFRFV